MTLQVKARIKVRSWKINERKLASVLANDPKIRAKLESYAQEVVTRAGKRMNWRSPPRKVVYERYKGQYWSADPKRVVSGMGVKKTKTFPTKKGVGDIPVALIVFDHPYSRTYEYGEDEFPKVGAFSAALTATANSKGKQLKRRYAKKTP